jgi:hypothetical protein
MIKSTTCVALATAALLCAQERIKSGLWENTVTSHGRSITRKNCLIEAELAMTNGTGQAIRESIVKTFAGTNGSCTLKDPKIEGNSMTSQIVCGATSSTTVMIFHGDTAETTSTSTKGGVIKVTHITGRRLGVCP